MKKIKQAVLLLLLFVSFAQTAAPGVGPIAARAAGAEGLVKEKGKYYFYADGKKVKNQWETIGADKY